MATESSAIARLVDAARNRGPDGVFEPMEHRSDPPSGKPPQKQKQSSGGAWWLVLVAVIVIGGSVTGGYLLAQQQGDDEGKSPKVAESEAQATEAVVEPSDVAAAREMPPVPNSDPATIDSVDAMPAEDIEEELEPALGEAELALASKTGFDILVEPKGAKVTLDGHAIGTAPLRVRNLLPGAHQISIEGPDGYFGQHQEFDLAPGEAMVLRLSLDRLEPGADSTPPSADVEKHTASGTSKNSRKARKKRNREVKERRARAPNENEEKALAGAGEVSLGTLMLGAKPPCQIIINGKKTGLTTPQRSIQLPAGTHRVELVNKKLSIHKSFKVRIKAGRTTRAIQDLTKKL